MDETVPMVSQRTEIASKIRPLEFVRCWGWTDCLLPYLGQENCTRMESCRSRFASMRFVVRILNDSLCLRDERTIFIDETK